MEVSHIPYYSLAEDEKVEGNKDFLIVSMQEVETEKKEKIAIPNRHRYFAVIWIQKSSGIHFIDFEEYPVKNNQLFFINPGQVHLLRLTSLPDGRVLLFTEDFLCRTGIEPDFLIKTDLFFVYNTPPFIEIGQELAGKLEQITTNLETESQRKKVFSEEIIRTQVKLFLLHCSRFKKENTSLSQAPHRYTEWVQSFQFLLENHYKEWHKVHHYAEKIAITSNHLNDVIRKNTGKTAKEWIQNRIILEAKRNAYFTNTSLKEIAYGVGFNDPAHFSKFFKNCVGKSFTKFRESLHP